MTEIVACLRFDSIIVLKHDIYNYDDKSMIGSASIRVNCNYMMINQ